MSACVYGSPLLLSFPHFYGADKSVLEQIDGLNPRQKDHENYLDIHPVRKLILLIIIITINYYYYNSLNYYYYN